MPFAASSLPNALTASRLLLGLAFPLLPPERRAAALVFAGLTEVLDGWLSRRFGWASALGRVLDPIADKVFFLAAAATFAREGRFSWRQVAMLATRDIVVVLGAWGLLLYAGMGAWSHFKPQAAGKAVTALQYAAFFSLFFWPAGLSALAWAAFLAGLAAGAAYCARTLRDLGLA